MTKLHLEYTEIEYTPVSNIVEVEFPIYRKDVYHSTSVYMKIHEDRSAIKLEIKEPEALYDMTQRYTLTLIDWYDFDHDIKWRRNLDLVLGRNEYELTKEKFYTELRQFGTIIERLFQDQD